MNEQVEQKANELLVSLIDKAQQGMEFAEAQIPDVIEQLLVWKMAVSAAWMTLSIFTFLASTVLVIFLFRIAREDSDSELASLGALVLLVGFGLSIAFADTDWIQIWLAPKVYLLEYAASLAK